MTAQDIIHQARERLGDLKCNRWTDARLLYLVSQGQIDMCLVTGYIRKSILIPMVNGSTIYNLPADCFAISRVEYNNSLLPLYSRDVQEGTTVPLAEFIAYKSNLDMRKLEIHPEGKNIQSYVTVTGQIITDDGFSVSPQFGVVTSSSEESLIIAPYFGVATEAYVDTIGELSEVKPTDFGDVFGSSLDKIETEYSNGEYGVTLGLEYTLTNVSGFVSDVKGHIVSGNYGLVASINKEKDTFKVYYIATPRKLRNLGDILQVPDIWQDIITRYVVGTALQDDNDANNIARGENEIHKFSEAVNKIAGLSARDFSRGSNVRNETEYRRI